MRKAAWIAIWEWLPGVIGGGLPLLAFFLAALFSSVEDDHYGSGLISHLLVMGIVTSGVCLITSFGRLVTGKIPNFLRDGRAPIMLTMLLVIIVVYCTALYALMEAGVPKRDVPLLTLASWGLCAALVSSLYMEFAIARLHVLATKRRAGSRNKSVQGSNTPAPVVGATGER